MTSPKTDRPIINVDLDNVLADFSHSIKRVAESTLGRSLPDSPSWSMWEDWDIPQGAWRRIFQDGVRDGIIWTEDPPIEGAIEGMWELSDSEYYLRIVTHRLVHISDYDLAVRVTSDWLKRHKIPYRSLAVIGAEPKSNYAAELLIDDGPHNIEDWVKYSLDSSAIVFDAPWNQDVEVGPMIHRAQDWNEVVELVKELV